MLISGRTHHSKWPIKPQSSISICIEHLEERLSHDVIFVFLQELLLSNLTTWVVLEKLVKSDHGINVGHSVLFDQMFDSVQLDEIFL